MNNLFFIFMGCGLGGLLRYGVAYGVYQLMGPFWSKEDFPYGTIIVNISGCMIMGFLFALILDRTSEINPYLRDFLIIGFLGGYTTFSSFSMETILLLESGHWLSAILNVFLSISLCIGGCWAGLAIGRQYFG